MSWRTVVISSRAKIEYSMGYMVVRGQEIRRIFMDEVETVMIETTAASLTAAWVNECIRRKIRIIFCDEKRNPAGEVQPYRGSFDTSRHMREQIRWPTARKYEVWKRIVEEKIKNQEQVLRDYGHADEADLLSTYTMDVLPGDTSNREGHAAKVYFNALWGKDFSRREENEINAALNYGYAILLSACNREITACGYLTQIGLFHDNVFNPFNLGSDVMEPFRPLVDREVLQMAPTIFGPDEKKQLVSLMYRPVHIRDKETTVSLALGIYIRSIFAAMDQGDMDKLSFAKYP